LKAKGSCSKIDLEYFKLSSFDDDNKGPSIDFAFGKATPFHFNIDAKLYLLGVSTGVNM